MAGFWDGAVFAVLELPLWILGGGHCRGAVENYCPTGSGTSTRVNEASAAVKEFKMRDVFIYDHLRSPRGIGKPNGSLHEITAVNLITQIVSELKNRNELPADSIDEMVFGVVTPLGEQGATTVRMVPVAAGFSHDVPSLHVNNFCASGLEAVSVAAAKIRSGWSQGAIAGGFESMSRTPPGTGGEGVWGVDPAFTSQHPSIPQGVAADLLATLKGFTREDLDSYSLSSQQRAATAQREGRFADAIHPITDIVGSVVLSRDELPQLQITAEVLAELPPAFAQAGQECGFDDLAIANYPHVGRIRHLHTAGSSSSIADGAATILLGTKEFGQKHGLTPRAVIRATATMGSDPLLFLDASPKTSRRALANAGMSVADIDLWEINEAFAAVPLLMIEELKVNHDQMNVNGGAIALGHPLGATGAMILGTLIDELIRTDRHTGVATLCAASGMGIATVIERV